MSPSTPAHAPHRRSAAARCSRARKRRGVAAAVVAAGCAAAGSGCFEITDPYPRSLPPNLHIASTPARGAVVEVGAAASVVLQFDRPMEKSSVQRVQRLSFLLPLAVHSFEGRWDAAGTSVVFDLTEFPAQPGATYEARFVGLRTADGELYNGGPFDVRFRTRGRPDLFPMRPHARVATRVMCRREGGDGACGATTLHFDATGTDSLRMRWSCEECTGARVDWFRRHASRIEWLGWDDVDAGDAVLRRVRWPQPPPVLATPTAPGAALAAGAQTATDGTQLVRWRTLHAGTESPTSAVRVGAATIEVVYSASATFELDYALRGADGVLEHRRERWWLYPGVGLVQRDVRSEREDGTPPARVVETLVPSLVNFAP